MQVFSLGASAMPTSCRMLRRFRVVADGFPSFLPKEVEKIKDPFARNLAKRIQRLPVPVKFSENLIMSSCVKPLKENKKNPIVLLHGFDSSCLEWRYTYPLLEEAGFEAWAVDILGWGFSDLEKLPPCDVVSKRDHFYQLFYQQFWNSYIRRPMILVGPSLGSAVAIDFAVTYPEAVEKLVLIAASVYAEGTGNLATLPKAVAYAGAYLLKSIPLRLYANYLTFSDLSFNTSLDGTNVKQKTLIIWGENDRIISNKLAVRLHCELPDATIRQIANCGHLPHVEKPDSVVKLIAEFVQREASKVNQLVAKESSRDRTIIEA
ncbi:alpha/beta hydrolase domain-containing protein VTE7-like isoform X3 [Prosopis cineraria]|uniref:alpha/beta hydrolase domain-containing protein VTE7-like isoform X3 n=1 Tax=Prosopis cineraria TaxID=364024 RepID=UPI002410705E|nr:alpha/beta hydrolase domain-containing protein VTE7-like isoform X3 [Prosopis cineraria]